jgi:hypothetical protein
MHILVCSARVKEVWKSLSCWKKLQRFLVTDHLRTLSEEKKSSRARVWISRASAYYSLVYLVGATPICARRECPAPLVISFVHRGTGEEL